MNIATNSMTKFVITVLISFMIAVVGISYQGGLVARAEAHSAATTKSQSVKRQVHRVKAHRHIQKKHIHRKAKVRPVIVAMKSKVHRATAAPVVSTQTSMATNQTAATAPVANMNVSIQNLSFQPGTIQVSAGATVTWTNNDTVQHTVTSDNGSFDSGVLNPGATFHMTFQNAGSYPYHCSIHTFMHGTVSVGQAASSVAAPAPTMSQMSSMAAQPTTTASYQQSMAAMPSQPVYGQSYVPTMSNQNVSYAAAPSTMQGVCSSMVPTCSCGSTVSSSCYPGSHSQTSGSYVSTAYGQMNYSGSSYPGQLMSNMPVSGNSGSVIVIIIVR